MKVPLVAPAVPSSLLTGNHQVAPSFCDGIQSCFKYWAYHGRMKTIRRFWADESGATAIEYGLIAAGIALAIISAVQGVGTKLSTNFGKISTSLK